MSKLDKFNADTINKKNAPEKFTVMLQLIERYHPNRSYIETHCNPRVANQERTRSDLAVESHCTASCGKKMNEDIAIATDQLQSFSEQAR